MQQSEDCKIYMMKKKTRFKNIGQTLVGCCHRTTSVQLSKRGDSVEAGEAKQGGGGRVGGRGAGTQDPEGPGPGGH